MGSTQQQGMATYAFLSLGYRPFFLAAGLWALTNIGLWIAMLWQQLELPSAWDPLSWHAHEALFGYLSAVLTGFLLTAVPNWTGRFPLTGWPLLGLFALWMAGRVAIIVSDGLSSLAVAALDLSGFIVLAAYLLREIVAGKNWRNLAVVGLIGVFIAGNARFHWEAAVGGFPASGLGLRIGLAAAIMMISLIGGRIVPAFTRNWLVAQGRETYPAKPRWLDGLTVILSLIALTGWVVFPDAWETASLLLVSGVVQAVRLARWRGLDTGKEPLLWILHVGYAFVPLGMLCIAGSIGFPDIVPPVAAQHLWMAGAIGVMTLAIMTRATLGHAGRVLTAGTGTATIYLLVIVSVLLRLSGSIFPQLAMSLWTFSALLWGTGFMGFVLLYGRLLIRPGT